MVAEGIGRTRTGELPNLGHEAQGTAAGTANTSNVKALSVKASDVAGGLFAESPRPPGALYAEQDAPTSAPVTKAAPTEFKKIIDAFDEFVDATKRVDAVIAALDEPLGLWLELHPQFVIKGNIWLTDTKVVPVGSDPIAKALRNQQQEAKENFSKIVFKALCPNDNCDFNSALKMAKKIYNDLNAKINAHNLTADKISIPHIPQSVVRDAISSALLVAACRSLVHLVRNPNTPGRDEIIKDIASGWITGKVIENIGSGWTPQDRFNMLISALNKNINTENLRETSGAIKIIAELAAEVTKQAAEEKQAAEDMAP